MTTLTLTLAAGAKPLRAVAGFLADLVAGIREAREMRDRYTRLSQLSDRELARLGIDRQSIPQAAARGIRV